MKNGKISKLFDCLYLSIASAFTVLFCMIILSRHFRGYEENNSYMKISLQEEYTNDFENWRIVIQMTAFMILILSSIGILFGASYHYILSKSKNGKVPSKFGRYQRNIYTFSETVANLSFIFLCSIIGNLVIHIYSSEVYSKSKLQTIFLLLQLLFDLIISFIFPLLHMRKLLRKMPDLFHAKTICASSTIGFYVRQPELIPKEDITKISESSTFKYAIVINVKEAA